MKNKYILTIENTSIYNEKAHDMFRFLETNYIIININKNELDFFFSKYNNKNNIILFYNVTHQDVNIQKIQNDFILEFYKRIENKNIEFELIYFTFDFWYYPEDRNEENKKINSILSSIFKAKKYKVITFANNIEQLNLCHNDNYISYKKNIIFLNLWCCYKKSFCKINKNPIKKLLISGSRSYPWYKERKQLSDIKSKYIEIYNKNINDIKTINNNYNLTLNKFYCCFSSSVHIKPKDKKEFINTHCILLKTFEILSSGSLLVMPLSEENYIKKIGLKHNKNCYLINLNGNIEKQIKYIFDNCNFYNKVRMNGYNHALENLTIEKKIIEFNKKLYHSNNV